MTTSSGRPVGDNQNSITAGPRVPVLMEDREFHPEEIEIARALASQASLAIQLTRLANAARQSAVLAERNQMAGEIHDSLAQFFTGISMQLGAAPTARWWGRSRPTEGKYSSHLDYPL